jgi:hypothetical protein
MKKPGLRPQILCQLFKFVLIEMFSHFPQKASGALIGDCFFHESYQFSGRFIEQEAHA